MIKLNDPVSKYHVNILQQKTENLSTLNPSYTEFFTLYKIIHNFIKFQTK